jgi:hypothetical protein
VSGDIDGSANRHSTAIGFAEAGFGVAVPAFSTGDQGIATEVALPATASISAALASDGKIRKAFGSSPSYFAMGEIGGAHQKGGAGSETADEQLKMTINPGSLVDPKSLLIGFYGDKALGSGFSSLTIDVNINGFDFVDQTFTSLSKAEAYFSDDPITLVSLQGAGAQNVTISMSETTTKAGQGFYTGFVLGDPPTAGGSTFVYAANSGADMIHDFVAGGADHSVLNLPSSEFGSLANVLHDVSQQGVNTVLQGAGDDVVTLQNVTVAALKANSGDFAFHG